MMPGMDGYAVLAQLRAEARTAAVPVVFVTALGTDEQAVRLIRSGAADYIAKPFDTGAFLARLALVMRPAAEDGQMPAETGITDAARAVDRGGPDIFGLAEQFVPAIGADDVAENPPEIADVGILRDLDRRAHGRLCCTCEGAASSRA
jgi:CheY-like chemotaxis protein